MKLYFFFLSLCIITLPGFAERIYVNRNLFPVGGDDIGGPGTSWDNAYKYIQDALVQTEAGRGDEIWVAAGVYYPDQANLALVSEYDRNSTITLKDGVSIYGGFAGWESALEQRNWIANKTTIDGGISRRTGGSLPEERSYTVFSVSADTEILLDGITVRNSNASVASSGLPKPSGMGGAIYMNSSTCVVTLKNCVFEENMAWDGGAVYGSGTWIVDNCDFKNNHSYRVGGVAYGGGTWRVSNSNFINNSSSGKGGVNYGSAGEWRVTDSNFTGNTSGSNSMGGVAYGGNWKVERCTFSNNSSREGGVAYSVTWRSIDSNYINNSASSSGGVAHGGVWTAKNSTFKENSGGVADDGVWWISNCRFVQNNASTGGVMRDATWHVVNSSFNENSATYGAVFYGGTIDATNSVFIGNEARIYGGISYEGTQKFVNSTFSKNIADSFGAISTFGSLTVLNCIFASDNKNLYGGTMFDHTYEFTNADPTRAYNIIAGGAGEIRMADGSSYDIGDGYIINSDPLFVNLSSPEGVDGILGSSDDGLRLQNSSPAISLGLAEHLPYDNQDVDYDGDYDERTPLDFAGFNRIQGGSLDLGAYEYIDPNYLVLVNASSGGIVSPSGSLMHISGTNLAIAATPNTGYVFNQWTGDASGNTNPLSITVNQNITITATFTADLNDNDDDGLTNYQELVTYGTNPDLADTAGDGLNDGDIVAAGFDPNTDFSSLISLMRSLTEDARTGSTTLDINNMNATLRLQIERSDDLSIWSKSPDDIMQIEIPLDGDQRFFRFAIPQE